MPSISLLPYAFLFLSLIIFLLKRLSPLTTKITNKTEKNLPPSPPKLPIIGNLHQLGLNPHLSLQSFAKKHGPIMLLHLGSKPTLVISSAEAAKEVMKTHDLAFSNRPISNTFSRIFYNGKDVAFAPYSEHWKRVKNISVLQLLSINKVQSFRKVREEEVGLWVEKIRQLSFDNTRLNLNELFISLTNDIFCRAALGRKYTSFVDEEEGGGENKMREILGAVIELLGGFNVGDYVPWLSWVDHVSGLRGRCDNLAKKIDVFMEGLVNDRILMKKKNGDDDDGACRNFLDILLETQKQTTPEGFALDKVTIKAVTFDLFIAGVDTVYTLIEWTMSNTLKHPNVMAKLREEAREIGKANKSIINEDDLEKMHYLKAVIKETLRLNGPFPLLVPRESRQDVKIMGYDIAAGTQILTNAWAIGRDPSFWDEPDEFRPERFLNNPIDYKGRFDFEFTPFGGGRRGCPGIGFAMIIAELVLANMVFSFSFALPGEKKLEDLDMTSIYGITFHRKYPLLVYATHRS